MMSEERTAAFSLYEELLDEHSLQALATGPESRSEELHLEFKEYQSLEQFENALAKALSGFANSDGGVIVFGVEDKSKSLRPFADYEFAEQRVQQLVSRLADPPPSGVIAKTLRSTERGKGYCIVLVPKSDLRPHQDRRSKKYFRRSGESFSPMEHYEIADAFGRRLRPSLVADMLISKAKSGFRSVVRLRNDGRYMARHPYFRVTDTRGSGEFRALDGGAKFGLPLTGGNVHRPTLQGGPEHVIHAGGILELAAHLFEPSSAPKPTEEAVFEIEFEFAAESLPVRRNKIICRPPLST